jgi:hypothetical protein
LAAPKIIDSKLIPKSPLDDLFHNRSNAEAILANLELFLEGFRHLKIRAFSDRRLVSNVRAMTDSALVNFLLGWSEQKVRNNPNFYILVVDAYRRRINV